MCRSPRPRSTRPASGHERLQQMDRRHRGNRRPGSTMNCELTAAWIGRPRIDIRRGTTPRTRRSTVRVLVHERRDLLVIPGIVQEVPPEVARYLRSTSADGASLVGTHGGGAPRPADVRLDEGAHDPPRLVTRTAVLMPGSLRPRPTPPRGSAGQPPTRQLPCAPGASARVAPTAPRVGPSASEAPGHELRDPLDGPEMIELDVFGAPTLNPELPLQVHRRSTTSSNPAPRLRQIRVRGRHLPA